MRDQGLNRFADLTFDDFRTMAGDESLSRFERIGFPDEYRSGHEKSIASDIASKLGLEDRKRLAVLDIGPGCSDLPVLLREVCRTQGHSLALIDSPEMLAHHPDEPWIEKHASRFPDCGDLIARRGGAFDAILAYSVLHYVFPKLSVFEFLDRALELLAPGGRLLIGDVPNISKRKRFFASDAGREFHRDFTGTDEDPELTLGTLEPDKIDDAVVIVLIARARAAGFEAYVVPQPAGLPMANRREDLLFTRP